MFLTHWNDQRKGRAQWSWNPQEEKRKPLLGWEWMVIHFLFVQLHASPVENSSLIFLSLFFFPLANCRIYMSIAGNFPMTTRCISYWTWRIPVVSLLYRTFFTPGQISSSLSPIIMEVERRAGSVFSLQNGHFPLPWFVGERVWDVLVFWISFLCSS